MGDIRRILYFVGRAMGDILSVKRGRMGTRIGWRALGRFASIILRNIFRAL
jgi:hypothetical protein